MSKITPEQRKAFKMLNARHNTTYNNKVLIKKKRMNFHIKKMEEKMNEENIITEPFQEQLFQGLQAA